MEQTPIAECQPWLDTIQTADEMAVTMKMSKGKLLAAARGKHPKIVGFWINERVVKFHPRSVFAKMAANAGLSVDLIAASYGTKTQI